MLHSADACIGCQYCTWNCSYGVPQYNPERGVVGKCDMCHNRLGMGQRRRACRRVPEGAIQIEIVNATSGARAVRPAHARASGLPLAAIEHLVTTRITLPANLPPNTGRSTSCISSPPHPHWPLVVMTVLTQLSVGAFATIWLLHLLGRVRRAWASRR